MRQATIFIFPAGVAATVASAIFLFAGLVNHYVSALMPSDNRTNNAIISPSLTRRASGLASPPSDSRVAEKNAPLWAKIRKSKRLMCKQKNWDGLLWKSVSYVWGQ